MSTNFIEDLLAQIQAPTKAAADEGKESGGQTPEEKREEDRLRGKKEENEEEGKKEAGDIFAELSALSPELKKIASLEAESMFLADLRRSQLFGTPGATKVASDAPAVTERELFDYAFEQHTEKLASADPEYAAILQHNMQKAAFEQSYYETLDQVKQAALAQQAQ